MMGPLVQMMDMTSYETFDVEKPKDVANLTSGIEVEYLRWGSNLKIIRKNQINFYEINSCSFITRKP